METFTLPISSSKIMVAPRKLRRLMRRMAWANAFMLFVSCWLGAMAPMVAFGLALMFCLIAYELS